jgi:hypothetical protein
VNNRILFCFLGLVLIAVPAIAEPITITFTAGDVKNVMADNYGDFLSNSTYLWGIWSIRAMPIVSGGSFEILSGEVNDQIAGDSWEYTGPNSSVVWADPYGTAISYFFMRPASEHLNTDAHPIYFISDQASTAFQSYAFDNTLDNGYGRSTYMGVCGIDVAENYPGCNSTNILPDSASFSFSINLDSGSSLLGWQFLVDGSKYYQMGAEPTDWTSSSLWIEDFIGGDAELPYESYGQSEYGGGLAHDVGNGYQVLYPVPEPAMIVPLGIGLAALIVFRKRG